MIKNLYTFIVFMLLFGANLNAQDHKVSGTVISEEDQLGVIGATVYVKDQTTTGTTTDFEGTYSITVPSEDAILVFSYTGMETVEIPVDGRSTIDLTMTPDISTLEQVVVVGYGTQKRSKISGSVSVVTAEEITETPVLRVEQALQGRSSGVQVSQNSGSPGSALSIKIRGTGTINNSSPLFIVDGIPADGLDFLNPSDIESINVLKDAASAAIYGSRGANGVVLITTKSGKKNQAGKINYESYYGIQNNWRKLSLLNAREYAIIQNESYIAAGRIPRPEFSNPDILGEGTDWQDAIFEAAPITSHQIGVTGGNATSTYAVTANYFKQDGIVGGDKSAFERYTVRLNATHDLKSWLTVGNTLGFTKLSRNGLSENNEFNSPLIRAINMDPVTPVRKGDGTYAYSVYSDTDITNPVNAIEQTYDTWNTNRVVGSVYGLIKFSDNISFRSTYSVDATFANQDIFRPRFDLSNDPILSDAPAQEKNLINSVAFNNNTWRNWQWENVLIWKNLLAQNMISLLQQEIQSKKLVMIITEEAIQTFHLIVLKMHLLGIRLTRFLRKVFIKVHQNLLYYLTLVESITNLMINICFLLPSVQMVLLDLEKTIVMDYSLLFRQDGLSVRKISGTWKM